MRAKRYRPYRRERRERHYTVQYYPGLPNCVGIAPHAEATRLLLELIGAGVFLDGVAVRAFLDVHTLATVCCYPVASDLVAAAAVFSVRPLRSFARYIREVECASPDRYTPCSHHPMR